jgi:Ca2+-binding RTX toxin-like protein
VLGNRDNRVSALGGNDRVDTEGGDDYVDAGSGADTVSGGDGEDTLVGGADNDQLSGDDGDDDLIGGAGNDVLAGGAGADIFEGGIGDDYYADFSSAEGDYVIEAPSQGNDTLRLVFDEDDTTDGRSFNLGTNGRLGLENVELGGKGNFDVFGNGLNNHLVGNADDNRLSGLAGRDLLRPGGGDDVLIGGSGDDAYELFCYWEDSRLYANQNNVEIIDSQGSDQIFLNFFWSGDENRSHDPNAMLIDYLRGFQATMSGEGDVINTVLEISSALNSQKVTVEPGLDGWFGIESLEIFAQSVDQADEEVVWKFAFLSGDNAYDITDRGVLHVANVDEPFLDGTEYSDIIQGSAGDDPMIDGRGGQDFLRGNGGQDHFVFYSTLTSPSSYVVDFEKYVPTLVEKLNNEGVTDTSALACADAIFDFQHSANNLDNDEITLAVIDYQGIEKLSANDTTTDKYILSDELFLYIVRDWDNSVGAIYLDDTSTFNEDYSVLVFGDWLSLGHINLVDSSWS